MQNKDSVINLLSNISSSSNKVTNILDAYSNTKNVSNSESIYTTEETDTEIESDNQTTSTDLINTIKKTSTKTTNIQGVASVVKTLQSSDNIDSFTDEELANFCSTFCKIIIDTNKNITIDNATKALQQAVLQYFRDGESNQTITDLSLVLGTSVTYETINTASSLCSCNSMNGYLTESSNISCLSVYKSAMLHHLINMFGDIEFYKNWFFTFKTPPAARKAMVSKLKLLIDTLLLSNYNLSFKELDFYCTVDYTSDEMYIANKTILENYKKVLDLVISDCGLSKNKNKIKLYGQQFGKLLPNLKF